jgi:glucokinase
MGTWCVGIDLGGTNTKFGLLDGEGRPGPTLGLPTPTDRGSDGVVDQIVAGTRQLLGQAGLTGTQVRGVGIGAPGPLRIAEGVVVAMPNIPGMENCRLRDRVGEALHLPAVLENDANAAAYGEFIAGTGRATRDMVMLTLGTGVGSGIIVDGRILHGSHEMGGELGHTIIVPDGEPCNCGQRGCLERYCSATYLAERTARKVRSGQTATSLRALLDSQGALTARDIHQAVRAGDGLAKAAWEEGIYYLALGCVNICRIFDPQKIVLSGGMTLAGEDLMAPLREHVARLHWTITPLATELAVASLGADAGVIGAAGVAWQALRLP